MLYSYKNVLLRDLDIILTIDQCIIANCLAFTIHPDRENFETLSKFIDDYDVGSYCPDNHVRNRSTSLYDYALWIESYQDAMFLKCTFDITFHKRILIGDKNKSYEKVKLFYVP